MSVRIKMFQTAAGESYEGMLDITAQANRLYCEKYDIEFETHLGVMRGFHPWQSTLNRIIYLKEQLDAGFDGWIFYLDADAYVYGQSYDVRRLIRAGGADFYFAPGGLTGKHWDVNAGIFLINLGSQAGKDLANAWYYHLMSTTEDELREAHEWHMIANDQERLQDLLSHREDFSARLGIVPREFLNDQGADFVRQLLRANSQTIEERVARLKQDITGICSGTHDNFALETPPFILRPVPLSEMDGPHIKMFQTADADNYAEMIAVTSECNRRYCERHGIAFESFLGIKRGFFPWHACFNRIVYLKEQIEAGYNGWVFYLDADAFVFDHDFDVRRIITDGEGDYYFSPGGLTGEKWDVNDGVFLVDLGSEAGKALVYAWYDHFMGTSEESLREASEWQMVPSDQPRLHEILSNSPDLLDRLVHVPREVLNNEEASFVRQVLRSNTETLEDRVTRLKEGVVQAMSKIGSEKQQLTTGDGKPMLEDPEQYGAAYDPEFRRILAQYAPDARSFLEWGAGYTTRMIIEHIGSNPAEIFVTMDENCEYLDNVVAPYRDLEWLHPKCISVTGPCVDQRDTGLNYSTYPLSLGRQFDFIFIDGRRRMECAMMALLMARPNTIVAVHDYRRTRYQPVHAFYRIIEDGPQFRIMLPRSTVIPTFQDMAPAVMALMGQNGAEDLPAAQDTSAAGAKGLDDLSAADALGSAHRHAQEGQLPSALAMVQMALSKQEELGEQEANARVLAASLLERQERLEEAAWMIARAKALAPEDAGIANDQKRILAALEKQSA